MTRKKPTTKLRAKPAAPERVRLGAVGAQVRYCGHDASFIADVLEVGDAVVIVANGPIDQELRRPAGAVTHSVSDFPIGGYWGRLRGILVVPRAQVELVKEET